MIRSLSSLLNPQLPQAQATSLVPIAAALKRHMVHSFLSRGQTLYRAGEAVNSIYIIESGRLRLEAPSSEDAALDGTAGNGGSVTESGPGCLVGVNEFYLARPAATTVRCRSTTCRVMALPRAAFGRLMVEAPAALSVLQFVITRSLSLDLMTSQDLRA